MSLDDQIKARAARAERWGGFAQPASVAAEIDQRRFRLDESIAQAEANLRQARQHAAEADQHLAALLTRRDEWDALEAEIAHVRMMRTHVEYVEREPVVIIPPVWSEAIRSPRGTEEGAA